MKVYYQVNSGKLWLYALGIAFLVTFLLPLFVNAANNDVILQSGTQITVNGITFTASQSGVDSITVDSGNFSMSMSPGSAIEITASGKNTFTVSPANRTESFSCNSSSSVLLVNGPVSGDAVTVTVTPSATACSSGGGVSSGGGGGSSGGGSTSGGSVATTPAKVAVATVPATTVANPSATAQSVSPVFTKALKLGSTTSDVKRIQQLLNSDPDTRIASSGVGSPGKETEFYGSFTTKAIQKFQLKYKVAKQGDDGYGNFGPKTRAKFAEVFKTGAVPTATPAVTPVPANSVDIQKQISDALKLIQELQAKIKAKSQ